MHKIKLDNSVINIRTNRQWRDFESREAVPEKVLKDQFDYQDPQEVTDGFFSYHGTWYHLDQFERLPEGALTKDGWEAIHNLSFSSGILLKISKDQEHYKVAYYWTSSS